MRVRLLLEEFRSYNQIFFLTPILIGNLSLRFVCSYSPHAATRKQHLVKRCIPNEHGNLSLMYVCSYLSPAVTRKQQPLIYKCLFWLLLPGDYFLNKQNILINSYKIVVVWFCHEYMEKYSSTLDPTRNSSSLKT